MSYIDNDGYFRLHWNLTKHKQVVETVLGKKLPSGVVIHHIDFDKTNNSNSNLLVCPDESYHRLMHRRTEAFLATGDANKRRCTICKQYDLEENLLGFVNTSARGAAHLECRRTRDRDTYYRRTGRSL